MKPLFGAGLATRSAEKWKPRRKLLTPCFHADILRGFLTVFNERSQKLVEHLGQETKKDFTDIGTPVTLATLGVILETMFGATIEALDNNSSKYITALERLADMYMSRNIKFWEWPDFIFDLTSGKQSKTLLRTVRETTNSVIQEKKKLYLSGNQGNCKAKRKAFMDLLLELHFESQELSEEDIRDEVNTFFAAV
ncbi:cytochrome P450 4c3 [Trichonephila clavata]|uniref:Cytochrome P450 4c3 n=1 Tax=Trichonephila clavata TaxID=2740835 RepID=A0A8X6FBG5_TRICU|nr:cytochrome P450 4c3 [Trichonephila clavata]